MKNFKILFLLIGIAFLIISCNRIKSDAKAYVKAEEDYVQCVMESVEDDDLSSEELDEIEKKYIAFLEKFNEYDDEYDGDEEDEFWSEVKNLETETEYNEDKLDVWMDEPENISDDTWDTWFDLIDELEDKYL